jgi:tRNA-specific 2-thiouridylase
MAEKILVGMSGGVDSSVTAWLLQQQGYDVEGLFMFNWAEDESGYCDAADDYQNALSVCEELGIPLHRADFSTEYRERVFQSFLDGYAAGHTPNPDVLCNREIKFKSFLEYALRLGADKIATGHYAGVREVNDRAQLVMAKDHNKDQTYFLALVTEQALRHVLFPLAAFTKPEVRAMANEAGLPNHARKDSTGICFIGERPMREFLGGYLEAAPGPIYSLDHAGRQIGEHQGLLFHTLGQRRGLGLGGMQDASDAPWFVVHKNMADNSLWVSQQSDHPQLMSSSAELNESHWIGDAPALPLRCKARIRHRQALQDCTVHSLDGTSTGLTVDFDQPQRAVAAGQYIVFYRDDLCLGGGSVTFSHTLEPHLQDDAKETSA